MKKIVFLFTIVLISKISHSQSMKEIVLNNRTPEKFLAVSDWFKLKEFYYTIQNIPLIDRFKNKQDNEDLMELLTEYPELIDEDGDQYLQFSKIAEKLLNDIQVFRLKRILDCLKSVIGTSNEWLKEENEQVQLNVINQYNGILNLFSGSRYFLFSDHGIFLFNFFGSNTPTSDLDYGLYLLTETHNNLNFVSEFEKIMFTNDIIIDAAVMFTKSIKRPKKALQELVDLNGYPDIFVIYKFFFKDRTLDEFEIGLNWIVQNFFSSIIQRICLNANIHNYRAWILSANVDFKNEQVDLMKKCYDIMMWVMNRYASGYQINDPESTNLAPTLIPNGNFVDDSGDFSNFILMNHFYDSLYSYRSRRESASFQKTLEKNSKGTDIFEVISGDNKTSINYRTVNFTRYLNIFFLETADDPKDPDIPYGANRTLSLTKFPHSNMLIMPLLSGAFSLASEAYSTIGPLDYVKFQGQYESGELLLDCVSLIEVFLDNFGMIIGHIVQIKHYMFLEIPESQSVSDTFSKYLIRAMAIFRLGCRNVYGVDLDSPFNEDANNYDKIREKIKKRKPSYVEITDKEKGLDPITKMEDHWIYEFYTKIKPIEGNDKKTKYFEILKGMEDKIKRGVHKKYYVDKLLKDIFEFYKLAYNKVFDNLDLEQVFFRRQRRTNLLVV